MYILYGVLVGELAPVPVVGKGVGFRCAVRSPRSATARSGERSAGEVESREERAEEENRGPQQNRLIALRHRPLRYGNANGIVVTALSCLSRETFQPHSNSCLSLDSVCDCALY